MVVRLLATGQYKPSARWHSLSKGKTLMAKITKDQAPAATKGTRPDVANMPRQSVVAFADYVNTLATHAPERLAEVVAPETVDSVKAAITDAGERYTSTVEQRIAKVISDKVEQAVAALTNEDKLNGYAGYSFDAEAFSTKTAPKTGRHRLSPEDKAARVVENATPEQLEALAALLAARGLAPAAE